MQLFLAPLQGFTDVAFRNAYIKHFGHIDRYYAPYIALQNDGRIRASQWRDILPDNNAILPVPQILPANAKEAVELTRMIVELGVYNEININMGCPYPMVTSRGKGSALMSKPGEVADILEVLMRIFGDAISFSVKMRCGLTEYNEVLTIADVLNDYPIKGVILHPRIGRQLYKGVPDYESVEKVHHRLRHSLYYNGDVVSLEDYNAITERFSWLQGVMLGRGVLRNPLLPREIVEKEPLLPEQRLALLSSFYECVIYENQKILSGEGHLLNKMKSYLPNLLQLNPDKKKAYKKMKKSNGMSSFLDGMCEMFSC